ncbi:unnamed protein product [Linum trigynum]|uniref:FAR1 domain-containing protein n=1 Tax=Linum trigynum TaxID=586398 RepID=A0AAV2GP56_9ROSI
MDDYSVQLDGGGHCHQNVELTGKRSLGFDLNVEYTGNDDDLDEPASVEHAPDILVANVEPVAVVEEQQNWLNVVGTVVPEDESTWEHFRFEDQDEFIRFYKKFAHGRGFSVRKTGAIYKKRSYFPHPFIFYFGGRCSKGGYKEGSILDPKNKEDVVDYDSDNERDRGETRFGCKAIARCRYEHSTRNYRIYKWTDVHDHELHDEASRRFLRSNREVTAEYALFAKINDAAGIPVSNTFDSFADAAGGKKNLPFIQTDLKNYIQKTRRKPFTRGEANMFHQYFKSNLCVIRNYAR